MNWNPETPIISLWMPWANWVMLGWKEIETRTHQRLKCLVGKTIGIHAAIRWDESAYDAAKPFLANWQLSKTRNFLRIGGAILGTAEVITFRPLTTYDETSALIECTSRQRYGIVLRNIQQIEAIPCRGKQGIWYYRREALTCAGEKK